MVAVYGCVNLSKLAELYKEKDEFYCMYVKENFFKYIKFAKGKKKKDYPKG